MSISDLYNPSFQVFIFFTDTLFSLFFFFSLREREREKPTSSFKRPVDTPVCVDGLKGSCECNILPAIVAVQVPNGIVECVAFHWKKAHGARIHWSLRGRDTEDWANRPPRAVPHCGPLCGGCCRRSLVLPRHSVVDPSPWCALWHVFDSYWSRRSTCVREHTWFHQLYSEPPPSPSHHQNTHTHDTHTHHTHTHATHTHAHTRARTHTLTHTHARARARAHTNKK